MHAPVHPDICVGNYPSAPTRTDILGLVRRPECSLQARSSSSFSNLLSLPLTIGRQATRCPRTPRPNTYPLCGSPLPRKRGEDGRGLPPSMRFPDPPVGSHQSRMGMPGFSSIVPCSQAIKFWVDRNLTPQLGSSKSPACKGHLVTLPRLGIHPWTAGAFSVLASLRVQAYWQPFQWRI